MGRPRLSERDLLVLGTGAKIPAWQPRGRRQPPAPPKTAVGTTEPDATRVLGLDLAMGTTGWCLLVGGRPQAHGVFSLPDRGRNQPLASWLSRRATELARQVRLLVTMHHPEIVGYEYPDVPRPFCSGGSKGREFSAVQGLSRAEGFLIAQWPEIGGSVPLVSVPVTQAKRLLTGRIGATKDQVGYALRVHRGWDLAGWSDHEIDAGAIALAAREAGMG